MSRDEDKSLGRNYKTLRDVITEDINYLKGSIFSHMKLQSSKKNETKLSNIPNL